MSVSLSESLEDYLEAIFHIESKKQAARAKDIAQRLNVKNSSVTGALHSLSEKGLINYAPYDLITLTPKGKTVANGVVRRHEALEPDERRVEAGSDDAVVGATVRHDGSSPLRWVVDRPGPPTRYYGRMASAKDEPIRPDLEQGVHEAAVAHIDFGRLHEALLGIAEPWLEASDEKQVDE